MKRLLPAIVAAAALIGYVAGYTSKPAMNDGPHTVLTAMSTISQ